jgi:hypothetical protein
MNTKKHQEAYFALRDYVYKNGNTGYTRLELHKLSKQFILPLLADEEACWVNIVEELSTRNLSEKGWNLFIEQFKAFCLDKFSVGLI